MPTATKKAPAKKAPAKKAPAKKASSIPTETNPELFTLKTQIAELNARAHTNEAITNLKDEMRAGDAALKQEIVELRQEMKDGFAAMEKRFEVAVMDMKIWYLAGVLSIAAFLYFRL